MHQHVLTDVATLRGYRQDLVVLKFLSGLSPSLRSQVRDQILGRDNIPTLTVTFFRVGCVSTGAAVTTAPSIEQSAMASTREKGRGRERDFMGGSGSFGGGRGFSGARVTVSDKRPRLCKRRERTNHTSAKCWEKFSRPEWA